METLNGSEQQKWCFALISLNCLRVHYVVLDHLLFNSVLAIMLYISLTLSKYIQSYYCAFTLYRMVVIAGATQKQ